MFKRRTVLASVLATMLSASHAGNITITEHTTDPFDNFKRGTSTFATGSMEYQPVALLYDRDLHVLDACGSVFPLAEDVYGERTLGEPLFRESAMEDVRPLTSGVQRNIGRHLDGSWVAYTLDGRRYHVNEAGDKVLYQGMSNTDPVHDFRLFDTTVSFGLRPDSRLVAIRLNSNHLAGLGLVQGGDWNDVDAMLYDRYTHKFPNDQENRLFTAHADGALKVTALDRDGDKWRVRDTATIADGRKFSRTVALLRTEASRNEQWLVRVDDKGRVTRLDMSSGDETELAKNVPALGALHQGTTLYTLSAAGNFRQDCPVKVVEAPKEEGFSGDAKRAVELDQELHRLYEAHSDDIRNIMALEMPSGIDDMDGQMLEQAFTPVFMKLEKFEREILNPIRDTYAALGEFGAEEWNIREKISQLTDHKHDMSGAYYNFTRELNDYDRFRKNIGGNIIADARIKFMIAEGQGKADDAARHYLAAMPFAEWGLKFDPENDEARDYLATAQKRAAKAIADEKQRIANARWPKGKEGSFRGPGNAKKLLQEALNYYNEKADRELHEQGARFFAINMREDHWKPGKTNVLGEILEYRLWLTIAQTMPNEPWFARVCDIEVGTLEAVKKPPFGSRSWRGCQKMPLDRVDAWDKSLLKESLKLIERNAGLTPKHMPADALDPSSTGISDARSSDGRSATKAAKSAGEPNASINEPHAKPADAPSARTDSGTESGGGGGWFFFLLLIVGGAGAAWYWQDRLPEEIRRHIPPALKR